MMFSIIWAGLLGLVVGIVAELLGAPSWAAVGMAVAFVLWVFNDCEKAI